MPLLSRYICPSQVYFFFSFATCPNVANSLIKKDTVIVIAGLDVGALLLCLVGEKWEAVFIHKIIRIQLV